MEARGDFFEKYLDARLSSIEKTVETGMRHSSELIKMVQAEVHSQNERMNRLDERYDSILKEIKESRRFLIIAFFAGLGVTVGLLSLIFQIMK